MIQSPRHRIVIDDRRIGEVRAQSRVRSRREQHREIFIRLVYGIAINGNEDRGIGNSGWESDRGILSDVIVGGNGSAVLGFIIYNDVENGALGKRDLEG